MLALFVSIAFLTEDDKLIKYHIAVGYAILIIICFRIVWGFIGPKYSRFNDFTLNIDASKKYLKNILDKNEQYIGHNPLAAIIMISILLITSLTIISGSITLGVQEGTGILSFLSNDFLKELELFEELHEIFANFLLFLIAFHLIGVFADKLLHPKHETLKSIFTGFKSTKEDKSIKLNILQKLISLFFLLILIYFFIYWITSDTNIFLI